MTNPVDILEMSKKDLKKKEMYHFFCNDKLHKRFSFCQFPIFPLKLGVFIFTFLYIPNILWQGHNISNRLGFP